MATSRGTASIAEGRVSSHDPGGEVREVGKPYAGDEGDDADDGHQESDEDATHGPTVGERGVKLPVGSRTEGYLPRSDSVPGGPLIVSFQRW